MPQSILFVCTANMCRSPFAEGITRQYAQNMGLDEITLASAGVRAVVGANALSAAIEVAKSRYGIDLSNHTTRPISQSLVHSHAQIIVMESAHAQEIAQRFPSAISKIELLSEYARPGVPGLNIHDPVGHSKEVYGTIFDEIATCCRNLLQHHLSVSNP